MVSSRKLDLTAVPKHQGRSRTTNGFQLLDGIDGRSAIARRFRDLLCGYHQEFTVETEAERVLARQAATLAVLSEQLQSRLVNGEAVDADTISKLSGQLRRILADLRRKAQAASPAAPTTIHEHLMANFGAAHDAPDADPDEEDEDD